MVQRVVAAKAIGKPSLRFFPLWHCAHPPRSCGNSMRGGPFTPISKGAGWQSLHENPAGFEDLFPVSTPTCAACENGTASIRLSRITTSLPGM
jgi:hypothetical protein